MHAELPAADRRSQASPAGDAGGVRGGKTGRVLRQLQERRNDEKVLALCLSGYSALAIAGFDVVALGVDGGVSDGNLTSHLIRSDNQPRYVALDAGSLLPGIAKRAGRRAASRR